MPTRVLITSALPYANGPLHFGHITGAYLPADAYARFRRLLGDEVLYICGSDEYGIAITLNADRMDLEYQEYVDIYHKLHKDTFDKLHFSFDFFSRTTNPFHQDIVQDFYNQLLKRGLIEKRLTEQLYSEEENRFLADRYVEGTCPRCSFNKARGDECQRCGADYEAIDLIHPRSKVSGVPLILKQTEHSYFLLDNMKEQLRTFIADCYLSDHVRKFVVDYIEKVKPRAITRDLSWGIPVPDFPDKVFYVWFDAPLGYISATMEWAASQGNTEVWKRFWLDPEVDYVQFIGKDNLPFHAVIFPAMEMGQSLPYKRVNAIVSSEFYLFEGRQFSKSDGNYIDMQAFLATYSVDKLRYVLAATAPETSDSEFTFEDFKIRCNSELVGKLGNFINRVLAFAEKNNYTQLLYNPDLFDDCDRSFLKDIGNLIQEVYECYNRYSLRKVTSKIMELAALGNVYFNHQAPWRLLKTGARKRIEAILFCACYCQKLLALISYPIIPESALAIWKMLAPKSLENRSVDITYARDLWNSDFLNPINEEFKLQSPWLLFTTVD
ncbi:methionine--tRNA ligase [Candidatus Chlamydia sanziniae]|uniref:Methionine--tRNA ligase n=1 Tax=Candidatus Chlamydia sanziniae TaxID=1806891 RepID=A0A1A9HW31_9CHLA|nr:methionine--tRNA ligase [Candidatus Chlamydia sanziniae]ANH78907.1 Methionyl-tRNA synthetase [Candidatus Chlamydia sanziniae]